MININKLNDKRMQRINRINTYAEANKTVPMAAALFVDQNSPTTTNKRMLAEVDYNFDVVDEGNYLAVLAALEAIGVTVITDHCTTEKIVKTLNTIVNEEIPECWGGDDMREYVEIFPGATESTLC
jgi:hypothetical protein